MSSHATSQESHSAQDAKRRKRKERSGKNRAPEPKDIVSGAGQPLDLSTRRELEEQLGHDFGQVRLHTDRDAGALTDMLGADAVAVGQDIFFREGTYRPGTADGQRLLAHELLHTVQNPHGLGALRAGRDLGEVSLPQQAMEREAESAAQAAVSDAVRGSVEEESAASEVEPGQATPGWLRYATVDADRQRMEQLDPATLVDRLVNGVLRSLRGDPADHSGRVRMQIARMAPELQDSVLDRLEVRLRTPEYDHLIELVDDIEDSGFLGPNSLNTPEPVPDLTEQLEQDRERRTDVPQPEKDESAAEAERGPENGEEDRQRQHTASESSDARRENDSSSDRDSAGPQGGRPSSDSRQPSSGARESEHGGAGQEETEQKEQEKQDKQASDEAADDSGSDGASTPSKEESAAENRPGATDQLVAGQQVPKEDQREDGEKSPTPQTGGLGKPSEVPAGRDTLDGLRVQDPAAEREESGPSQETRAPQPDRKSSAWDIELKPEDFLPASDLDVSGVPTADQLSPGSGTEQQLPDFPEPPPTRAEEVQEQRAKEDKEDARHEDERQKAAEESASENTGSEDGQARNLQGEQPAAHDPETAELSRETTSVLADESGRKPETAEARQQEDRAEKTGSAGSAEKTAEAEDPAGNANAPGENAHGTAKEQSDTASANADDAEAPESKQKQDSETDSGSTAPEPSPARDTHVTGATDRAGKGGGARSEPTAGPGGSAQSAEPSAPETRSAASTPEPRAPEPSASGRQDPSRSTGSGASSSGGSSSAGTGGRQRAGGGGGAGPAGKASKPKKEAPAPNLSKVSPEAGLSAASKLKPHKAMEALGGVNRAVDRSVGEDHKALASAPPTTVRPPGSPQTLNGAPTTSAPGEYSSDPADKAEAPENKKAEVEGAEKPKGEIPAAEVEEPSKWDMVKMGAGYAVGWVGEKLGFDVDPEQMAAQFAGLPTKDEALKQAKVGAAPGVGLKETADSRADEQGGNVDEKGQQLHSEGQDDASRPLGEDQIYPHAPKETLTGKVPGAKSEAGGGKAGGVSTGRIPPQAVSTVAEHDRGRQIQASFTDGRTAMSEERQTKDRDSRNSQQDHKQQVRREVSANAKAQAGERARGKAEVAASREDWRKEQDDQLESLGTKKTDKLEKIRKDVKKKEEDTDKDVEDRHKTDEKEVGKETRKAEDDAEKKRDKSVEDSGNWLSKAFEWIKNKFIEIRDAIVGFFKAARKAVIDLIKNFKETVVGWIEAARKFIVEAIKDFVEALVQLVKDLLQAIVELARRIRDLIIRLRDAAIRLVTELANRLKQMVVDLLNALGKMLSGILDALMAGLRKAVELVKKGLKAVMDFALKALNALGQWAMIAVDILSDPGAWLGKAKDSAVDGAKNHLFTEVKSAIKQWFNDKIEEILGLPKAIFEKLIKGGVSREKMAQEAWNAALPQLPLIIGELIVTKIVAKLIPGAGWVMAIVDALKAAWESLSEILAAFGAFINYLKAVKGGNAGKLFAVAVAAGVVALLEMLYQALLSGIGKYVGKAAKALRRMAKKMKPKKDKGKNDEKPKDDERPEKGQDGNEDRPRTRTVTNAGDRRRPPESDRKESPAPTPRGDKGKDESKTTKPTDTAAVVPVFA